MQSMYELFYRDDVLNIFCDASLRQGKTTDIAYGAIAVVKDRIIDSECRINSDSTSNYGEAKGMLTAVSLAAKYQYTFPIINIFCDSLYCVSTMNDYYRNWRIGQDGYVYSGKSLVPNQSPFIGAIQIIQENNLSVNIFHQKGHVELKSFDSVKHAISVFSRTNNIHRRIDYGFMRYISGYNNIIDNYTRNPLARLDKCEFKVITPFNNVFNDKSTLFDYNQKPTGDRAIILMEEDINRKGLENV